MAGKIRWDRQEWLPYLQLLAKRLNLREWTLKVDDTGPGNPTASAAVRHHSGRKIAMFDLSEDLIREGEYEQRHVAVHEVLHLHGAHAKHYLESILAPEQFRTWTMLNEYGHDALTEAVAPLMPLPGEILDMQPDGCTLQSVADPLSNR